MHITKILEIHQIMPLDINLTMVGLPRSNLAKGTIILIHYDLVMYIIRDMTVDAMKLKMKILCKMMLNIMRN
jgi:hypothetical protein